MVWYDSRQLEAAWQLLPAGPDAACACCGERWQYMGSVWDGRAALHTFRHRHHPGHLARVYADVRETDVQCELTDLRIRD